MTSTFFHQDQISLCGDLRRVDHSL
jgi:hypothetical protein